jgi:hypothetical protein
MARLGINLLIGGAIIMMLMIHLFPRSWMPIVLSQLLCEVGISIVIANSITRALEPIPYLAGTGSALIGFFRFLCAMLASLWVGIFSSGISLSVITLVFSILSWFFLNIQKLKFVEYLFVNKKISSPPS